MHSLLHLFCLQPKTSARSNIGGSFRQKRSPESGGGALGHACRPSSFCSGAQANCVPPDPFSLSRIPWNQATTPPQRPQGTLFRKRCSSVATCPPGREDIVPSRIAHALALTRGRTLIVHGDPVRLHRVDGNAPSRPGFALLLACFLAVQNASIVTVAAYAALAQTPPCTLPCCEASCIACSYPVLLFPVVSISTR